MSSSLNAGGDDDHVNGQNDHEHARDDRDDGCGHEMKKERKHWYRTKRQGTTMLKVRHYTSFLARAWAKT